MKPNPGTPRTAIDWRRVYERLEQNEAAFREAVHLSPERARVVLDERARLLARAPVRQPSAAEVIEVATFTLAGERYAIATSSIRRVVRLEAITPVPGTPDFVAGAINLQGEILAVFDLRALFGIAWNPPTEASRVFVLGDDHNEFGLVVDAALEVKTLRLDELHEPPGSLEGVGREYLRGVTEDALLVLDGAVLLHDDRLIVNQSDES